MLIFKEIESRNETSINFLLRADRRLLQTDKIDFKFLLSTMHVRKGMSALKRGGGRNPSLMVQTIRLSINLVVSRKVT